MTDASQPGRHGRSLPPLPSNLKSPFCERLPLPLRPAGGGTVFFALSLE